MILTETLVGGTWDQKFAPLIDLVRSRLAAGETVGEAVAVFVDGKQLVNVWTGFTGPDRTAAWASDTLACLFSAAKALAAISVLRLVDVGKIALETPVASFWPEFAQGGKADTTVRHVLAHLAGVPIADSAAERSVYDRTALARALEVQVPLWPPGTQGCFHSFTYGVLCGEIVRRIDGRAFPRFFREEISAPLELDLAFALGPLDQARCADLILVEDNPLLRMMRDPQTALGRSWRPLPWEELNSAQFRASDFPSLAGHGTALGLARLYCALANGGVIDGARLLSSALLAEMLSEQWHHPDAFIGAPIRMGLGVMLSNALLPFTGSARSFAQPGLGGAAGIGDCDARLSIGIVPNRLSGGIDNPALAELVSVVMASL
jgi:CubicO group peptidase (beta-lactamase class C family)